MTLGKISFLGFFLILVIISLWFVGGYPTMSWLIAILIAQVYFKQGAPELASTIYKEDTSTPSSLDDPRINLRQFKNIKSKLISEAEAEYDNDNPYSYDFN
jgi:hypothetical protein